jgi:hypothetical protein
MAATWYVDGVTGSDTNNCLSTTTACKTIGHAISLAASGDTVKVAAATYTENLSIGISLNILGAGASTTIIDGGGVNRVVFTSGRHVTLSGVTIQNGASQLGAGIYVDTAAALVLSKSVVIGNQAHVALCKNQLHTVCFAEGAGIFNLGVLTVSESAVSFNRVFLSCDFNCIASGGGIYNGRSLVISRSTIDNNVVDLFSEGRAACPSGGGVENDNGATLTLINSTVFGNGISSPVGGNGCGGAISNAGTLRISNSTISGNGAAKGGGIYGAATLQNSVVANNTGGNCFYLPTSKGYNLSSDATCSFSGPGDMNNTDPMLGPLQNNGGPTQTMALPSGSPAIDAGNPAGCTDSSGHLLKTDQRGKPRPDKEDTGGCDIGAYELQSD